MIANTAVEFKPHGIMELFDQAFRLYRNNFLKFVGIIAVAEVPLQLVQMALNFLVYKGALSGANNTTYSSLPTSGVTLVTVVIMILTYIFVSGLATAALTQAITDTYLGEEVSIGSSYRKIKGRWGTLLLAMFSISLLTIPLLIWTIIPCIGWLTGFGMLFFTTLVISQLIAPIIVIEQRSSGSAIRRAWSMSRRRFWWLIGFFLLLALFNMLVVQGPVQLVTLAIQGTILRGAFTANLFSAAALQSISTSLLTLILSLLYIPLASTCATLAYFDLRVRQEGFDLALMANQAEQEPLTAANLARQAPAIPRERLVTTKELGSFVLVTLIMAGIYAVVVGIGTAAVMLASGAF